MNESIKPDRDIHIGTSGWMYDHWVERFYPDNLHREEWLNFYSKQFKTVEVNTSFYHLPPPESYERWYTAVPRDFIFALKGSRYITHNKKLLDPDPALHKFFASSAHLCEKDGLVLWQIPPNMGLNYDRLHLFIRALPAKHSYAIEFRNKTWYSDEILNLLEDNNIALCLHDHKDGPSPIDVTAGFVYIRLHGPNGFYGGSYSDKALEDWAKRIDGWCSQAPQGLSKHLRTRCQPLGKCGFARVWLSQG